MNRALSAARAAALLGDATDRAPAYLSIADRFRLLVSEGRIPPGTRLPSERELTRVLGVSRTTVSRAYATLKDAGFLTSRQGSGTVASLPPRTGARDVLLNPDPGSPGELNLSCAAPIAPTGVSSAYQVAVEQLAGHLPEFGYFPSGLPALREAIASRYAERGLPTEPEEVLVTSGALSALAVVIRAYVDRGDRVLMESPTYPNAIATFRGAGARLVGADVDQSGWGTASVVETVQQVRPQVAYLMPDFHNPTGQLMGDAERARLAAALRRNKVLTVVDETMAEMSFADDPAPLPFAAHLPGALLVGSASKIYWGGLRIGWIRAPRARIADLTAARLTLDLGTPVLEQLALLELMRHRRAILEVRREQLSASRAALVAALASALPSWHFRIPPGGLSLWCELPSAASSALAGSARAHGLHLAPGPLFAPEGGLERRLRLPYTHPPEALGDAVARLVPAWEAATSGSRRRRTSPSAKAVPALVT